MVGLPPSALRVTTGTTLQEITMNRNTKQQNTGPTCSICGCHIAAQNEVTHKLFAGRDWSGARLLCATCHAEQRELYKDSPMDYYDRAGA